MGWIDGQVRRGDEHSSRNQPVDRDIGRVSRRITPGEPAQAVSKIRRSAKLH